VAGLAEQGFEQSIGWNGANTRFTCLYRGPGGKRCAIGHLIPDDKYAEEFDDGAGSHLGLVLRTCGVVYENFFDNLQIAHDRGTAPDVMRRNLRTVAAEHKLRLPAVLIDG
jgi:hypothetical protein